MTTTKDIREYRTRLGGPRPCINYLIRNRQIDSLLQAIDYLERLATQHNVDIGTWDVEQVFGLQQVQSYSSQLIVPPHTNAINQLFFEELEIRKEGLTPRVYRNFSKRLDTAKEYWVTAYRGRSEDYLHEVRTGYLERVKDYVNSITYQLKQLAQLQLGTAQFDLMANIKAAVAANKFLIFERVVDKMSLRFITACDIVLTEKNKQAGIDITVNLGKFIVEIDFGLFSAKVRPGKNNIYVEGNYHPHVNQSNGQICWGDGADQLSQYVLNGNVQGFLELIEHILKNYFPNNPYMPLYKFKERVEQIERANAENRNNETLSDYGGLTPSSPDWLDSLADSQFVRNVLADQPLSNQETADVISRENEAVAVLRRQQQRRQQEDLQALAVEALENRLDEARERADIEFERINVQPMATDATAYTAVYGPGGVEVVVGQPGDEITIWPHSTEENNG